MSVITNNNTAFENYAHAFLEQKDAMDNYKNLSAYQKLNTLLQDSNQNSIEEKYADAFEKYYHQHILKEPVAKNYEQVIQTTKIKADSPRYKDPQKEEQEAVPLLDKNFKDNEQDEKCDQILAEFQKHFIIEANEKIAAQNKEFELKEESSCLLNTVIFLLVGLVSISIGLLAFQVTLPLGLGWAIAAGCGTFTSNVFLFKGDVRDIFKGIAHFIKTCSWQKVRENAGAIILGCIAAVGNVFVAFAVFTTVKALLIFLGFAALMSPYGLAAIAIILATLTAIAFAANSFKAVMHLLQSEKFKQFKENVIRFFKDSNYRHEAWKDFWKNFKENFTLKNTLKVLLWLPVIGAILYIAIFSCVVTFDFWRDCFAQVSHLPALMNTLLVYIITGSSRFTFELKAIWEVIAGFVCTLENAVNYLIDNPKEAGKKISNGLKWLGNNIATGMVYLFCGIFTLAATVLNAVGSFYQSSTTDSFCEKIANTFAAFAIVFAYMGIKTQGKFYKNNELSQQQKQGIVASVAAETGKKDTTYQQLLNFKLNEGEMETIKKARYGFLFNRYHYSKSYADTIEMRKNTVMQKLFQAYENKEMDTKTLIAKLEKLKNHHLITCHRGSTLFGGFGKTRTQKRIENILAAAEKEKEKEDKPELTRLLNNAKTNYKIDLRPSSPA